MSNLKIKRVVLELLMYLVWSVNTDNEKKAKLCVDAIVGIKWKYRRRAAILVKWSYLDFSKITTPLGSILLANSRRGYTYVMTFVQL